MERVGLNRIMMKDVCILFYVGLVAVSGLPFVDRTGLDKVDWFKSGQDELKTALETCYNMGVARNVILFLGDGMGMSTVTAARWLQSQQQNKSVHELLLSWERFPHVALSRTYNTDIQTADSAPSATAFLTGYKAAKATLGVDKRVINKNCASMTEDTKVKSILHKSHDQGKWTGIVSTAPVTHATPAASYASTPERDWEADSDIPAESKACKDIAHQLVVENDFIRVVLGGGRRNFLTQNESDPERPELKGKRADGRNLMDEWIARQQKKVSPDKVKLVMNETDFKAVDETEVEYLIGLFEWDDMQYEMDRTDPDVEVWGEPSLTDMTEKAIKVLSRNEKGYFLLVEGSGIDRAHHDALAHQSLMDTIEMSHAVERALELTDTTDTLIVVTADHSHAFTMGGYQSVNTDIFGVVNMVEGGEVTEKLADDGLPYLILSYANGPGYYLHRTANGSISSRLGRRRNVTEDIATGKNRDKNYAFPADVPLDSESHGGEDVAIYAKGPMGHLFHGSHEQNYIAHAMMYASCIGENQDHCNKERTPPRTCNLNSSASHQAVVSFFAIGGITVLTIFISSFQ